MVDKIDQCQLVSWKQDEPKTGTSLNPLLRFESVATVFLSLIQYNSSFNAPDLAINLTGESECENKSVERNYLRPN